MAAGFNYYDFVPLSSEHSAERKIRIHPMLLSNVGKTPPFGKKVGINPPFGKGEGRDDLTLLMYGPTRPSCPVITLLTILLTIFLSLSFLYSSIYNNEI
jgi:hypothetical protein